MGIAFLGVLDHPDDFLIEKRLAPIEKIKVMGVGAQLINDLHVMLVGKHALLYLLFFIARGAKGAGQITDIAGLDGHFGGKIIEALGPGFPLPALKNQLFDLV